MDATIVPQTKETEIDRSAGRPTIMTDEILQKLESVFKLGVTNGVACNYADIAESTFYDHYKKDPVFRRKIDSAKDYARIAAGNVVVDSIVNGKDVESAKWWLAKKHSDEFSEPKRLSGVSIKDGDKEVKLIIEDYVS